MHQDGHSVSEPFEFDLASPAFKADPYPAYRQLRSFAPLHYRRMPSGRGAWLVTGYKEALAVFKDKRFIKDVRTALALQGRALRPLEGGSLYHIFNTHMLNLDPPDHTRLRRLVSQAFTPRMVEQYRESMQAIAHGLIDVVQAQGAMDLIEAFASRFPLSVITQMLGIPLQDRLQFREWANTLMEGFGNPQPNPQALPQIEAFTAYVQDLVMQKRAHPAEDLTGMLIRAESEGKGLTEIEVMSTLFLLLVAGHEMSVNLIGNSIFHLLQYPQQWMLLKEQPALIPAAIEECLRYNGPTAMTTKRWAGEDIQIGDTLIRRGEAVLIAVGAANHDPEEFQEPDTFDVTREGKKHLAFGLGNHYCLGAHLARLEGEIALSTLLRRLPDLRLNADPQSLTWRSGPLMMGLCELPVAFSPSPAVVSSPNTERVVSEIQHKEEVV